MNLAGEVGPGNQIKANVLRRPSPSVSSEFDLRPGSALPSWVQLGLCSPREVARRGGLEEPEVSITSAHAVYVLDESLKILHGHGRPGSTGDTFARDGLVAAYHSWMMLAGLIDRNWGEECALRITKGRTRLPPREVAAPAER